jgi:hypothetical protein
MKLKCKLTVEVHCPATAEIELEVPDEFKTPSAAANWVEDNLAEILNKLDRDHDAAYSAYVRSNYTLERPKRVYWDVDSDDVYNNVINAQVDLEEWEVVG